MSETREDTKDVKLDVKTPKRVLHFSDGVLEEYESEEDESENKNNSDKQIVLENWPTLSSAVNNMVWIGNKTLEVCDYLGEGLADFFGITSPKYEYEIEEYKRRVEQQISKEKKLNEEYSGWTQTSDKNVIINLNDINKEINDKEKCNKF